MPTVLITGSNRGMGLAHARRYAGRGWQVLATCRDPDTASGLQELADTHEGVSLHQLDITDAASVAALAHALQGVAIDVLLNNASFLSSIAEEAFGVVDLSVFERSYAVNALGPYRMATAFVEHVAASGHRKMVFMTSTGGSIAALQGPSYLPAYASGKVALNMLVRSLHFALKERGILVGLLEPGIVDTQGFRDLPAGAPAPHGLDIVVEMVRAGQLEMRTAEDAVADLQRLIDELNAERAGRFLRYDGVELPW